MLPTRIFRRDQRDEEFLFTSFQYSIYFVLTEDGGNKTQPYMASGIP